MTVRATQALHKLAARALNMGPAMSALGRITSRMRHGGAGGQGPRRIDPNALPSNVAGAPSLQQHVPGVQPAAAPQVAAPAPKPPSWLRRNAMPIAATGAAGVAGAGVGAGAGYLAGRPAPVKEKTLGEHVDSAWDATKDWAGRAREWAGKPIYEGAPAWATPTNIGLAAGGSALAIYALKKLLED